MYEVCTYFYTSVYNPYVEHAACPQVYSNVKALFVLIPWDNFLPKRLSILQKGAVLVVNRKGGLGYDPLHGTKEEKDTRLRQHSNTHNTRRATRHFTGTISTIERTGIIHIICAYMAEAEALWVTSSVTFVTYYVGAGPACRPGPARAPRRRARPAGWTSVTRYQCLLSQHIFWLFE